MAQWLSWLERRPVTAKVESSSLFWVVSNELTSLVNCIWIWNLSSAGRASALQAEGHRFEPYRFHILKENGEIAQLARAHGSYPWCRGFESPSRYYKTLEKSRVSDCRQRPRHFAEDFSLKEAKSQYFQDF